jgi:hypothetical protein
MPKYAYFNKHDGRVLQWIDTDAMNHVLPDASLLHECTESEWSSRETGEKLIKNGAVIVYVAPVKTQEEISAEAWHSLQADARVELEKSDITLLRCIENAIIVPAEWAAYRQDLRAIISELSGDASQGLPVKPAYPAGT